MITDEQIIELLRNGKVGDAGNAALGEKIDRGYEGARLPTDEERRTARAYCAEVWNRYA